MGMSSPIAPRQHGTLPHMLSLVVYLNRDHTSTYVMKHSHCQYLQQPEERKWVRTMTRMHFRLDQDSGLHLLSLIYHFWVDRSLAFLLHSPKPQGIPGFWVLPAKKDEEDLWKPVVLQPT